LVELLGILPYALRAQQMTSDLLVPRLTRLDLVLLAVVVIQLLLLWLIPLRCLIRPRARLVYPLSGRWIVFDYLLVWHSMGLLPFSLMFWWLWVFAPGLALYLPQLLKTCVVFSFSWLMMKAFVWRSLDPPLQAGRPW
jgi:hypothetical protein